jgi:tetratricopeptide (TPR) repeat protein
MLRATRRVLSLSPGNAMAHYLQAVMAARAGKYELARTLYARTGGGLDDLPAALLLSGSLDYQAGNHQRAIERLGRLVAIRPDNAKARRLLAAAKWRIGETAAVVAILEPLAARGDADSYSLTLLARALLRSGEPARAASLLARAGRPQATGTLIAAGQADLAALRRDAQRGGPAGEVLLIRALIADGGSDEALARAQRLQANDPGVPATHLIAGDVLSARGAFAAAAEQYRKAANLAFTEPTALRLVEALERAGKAEAAARVLQLFLEQNPRSVNAQLLAAGRFMAVGQWRQAIAIYEGLRRRLGNNDAALLANLAIAHAQAGEAERALAFARRAWSLDRSNPATADVLGWLLVRSGKDKAAGLALLAQSAGGTTRTN